MVYKDVRIEKYKKFFVSEVPSRAHVVYKLCLFLGSPKFEKKINFTLINLTLI